MSGLPPHTEAEELADFVTKFAGVLKKNPETRKRVVKMRRDDATGEFTGEAVVVFFRPESVQQAVSILSGMEYASGFPLTVAPHKKEKTGDQHGLKKRDKRVKLYNQDKELEWGEDEEQVHVIVEGIFTLDEVRENGLSFFDDLRAELMDELGKMGTVKSLKIFQHNPQGVVAIKFETPTDALRCVSRMEGRFFGGRQLKCHYYDGFTNYQVEETEQDRNLRVAKFGDWLGTADEPKE